MLQVGYTFTNFEFKFKWTGSREVRWVGIESSFLGLMSPIIKLKFIKEPLHNLQKTIQRKRGWVIQMVSPI